MNRSTRFSIHLEHKFSHLFVKVVQEVVAYHNVAPQSEVEEVNPCSHQNVVYEDSDLPEFIKAAAVWLSIISQNLRIIWTFERKTGKTGTSRVSLAQFDKVVQVVLVFTSFFALVSAQNLQSENYCCAK